MASRKWLIRLAALALFVQQQAKPVEQAKLDPLVGLAQHQREACESAARRKIVTGGRRSGKTETVVAQLCRVAIGGGECVYISLTRKLAKRTIWKRLKARLRLLSVAFKANESELKLELPGDGTIELGGADDHEAIERYRGPAYALVVIDECGAQNPDLLRALVTDVLRPALMDHQGELILAGTPGPTLSGFWYEQSNPLRKVAHPRWEWTIKDNPLFAGRWEAELEAVLEENQWDESHPTFRREYWGEWVKDASVLVYPYEPEANEIASLPTRTPRGYPVGHRDWRFVIGIDVGTSIKSMALVVWASNRSLPDDYLVHAEAHTGMLIHQLAERIRALRERYPGARVVMDAGGMGAAHAQELRRRYAEPIISAKKTEKASAITVMRDRLIAGRIKVLALPSLDGVRSEWSVLGWDEDHEQHHPNQADHYSDACLYGLRELRNWSSDDAGLKPEPKADSPEAIQRHLDADERAIVGSKGKKRRRDLWAHRLRLYELHGLARAAAVHAHALLVPRFGVTAGASTRWPGLDLRQGHQDRLTLAA